MSDENTILRTLACGHGRTVLGPDDSTLSRVWCGTCEGMIKWVRGEWSLGLPTEP